jgi:N-acetylmuramoyl-L-alanine amidase
MQTTRFPIFVLAAALLAACAPPPPATAPAPMPVGLPPVPRVDGPLQIRVVHPTPTTVRPAVDSTFIYGSVGTGAATLSINGVAVEVYPNGAFLAFLPTPRDGRWALVAEAGGRRTESAVQYRMPAAPAPGAPVARAPTTVAFPQPLRGTVSGGADTLATGSDVAVGRPTPTGPYRWFLPRGAALTVTGERAELLRVRLAAGTEAWVPANRVTLGDAAPPATPAVGGVALQPAREWVDVRVGAGSAPFLVEPGERGVALTLYGVAAPAGAVPTGGEPWVTGATWSAPAADVARLQLALGGAPWGFKAFYETDGTLVLRLRRAPAIDSREPFRGMRIVIDPGHPPAGATGPTGLTEAEANLAISLPLAEMLRRRGAEVTLTRTQNVEVSLTERVEIANRVDAHLLVSVHNNAFPEGVNPFRRHGTSTYYFHPHSAALARALQREIQTTTRIPDLGALTGNLALVRPTWMPSVLTESLFMALPDQESALRNPGFQRALAEAHVRGLEAFLWQF